MDTENLSVNLIRRFFATNTKPDSSWTNASGGIYSYQPTFNYLCDDPEGQSMTAYVFWNNSLMVTNSPVANGSGAAYSTAGFGVGSWSIEVMCGDDYQNGSLSQINWSYSSICLPQVNGLVANERYIGLVHPIVLNCSNNLALSACYWGTNEYALNSVIPCNDSFNVSLENGRNELVFIFSNSGLNSSVEFSVWAKNPDLDVFGFVLLWLFFGVYVFCIVMAVRTGLGVLYLVGLIPAILLGLEIVSISWYAGAMCVLLLSLTNILLLVFKIR
jgi:hypothetical protein